MSSSLIVPEEFHADMTDCSMRNVLTMVVAHFKVGTLDKRLRDLKLLECVVNVSFSLKIFRRVV